MEYIIIGSIAIAVFIFLYLIIKIEKLRTRANALFLEAEKYVTEDKLQYVCSNLYTYYLPNVAKRFVGQELFNDIIQMLYDKSRKLAKDLLDDGKRNKSYKEE